MENADSLITNAWNAHRTGNQSQAILQFEQVLRADDQNVDAHYGLGLARRANGDFAAAKASFEKALELSQKKIDAVRGVHPHENNLETYEDDRYMMLVRMLTQRLEELSQRE